MCGGDPGKEEAVLNTKISKIGGYLKIRSEEQLYRKAVLAMLGVSAEPEKKENPDSYLKDITQAETEFNERLKGLKNAE